MALLVGGALVVGAGTVAAAGAGAAAAGGAAFWKRRQDKKKKKKKLRQLKLALFGTELRALHPKHLTTSGIPKVLETSCSQLEYKGGEIEGIFRVPGSQNRINELAAMYEVGGDEADAISLEQESTHDVGGLFKLFLRRLPEPLCTFELYSSFVQIQEDDLTEKEWAWRVKQLFGVLPDLNYRIFIRLLPFFSHLTTLSSSNKMNPENLSIVFAPTLFYSRDKSPEAMLKDSVTVGQLLTAMIVRHEELIETPLEQLPPLDLLYDFDKYDLLRDAKFVKTTEEDEDAEEEAEAEEEPSPQPRQRKSIFSRSKSKSKGHTAPAKALPGTPPGTPPPADVDAEATPTPTAYGRTDRPLPPARSPRAQASPAHSPAHSREASPTPAYAAAPPAYASYAEPPAYDEAPPSYDAPYEAPAEETASDDAPPGYDAPYEASAAAPAVAARSPLSASGVRRPQKPLPTPGRPAAGQADKPLPPTPGAKPLPPTPGGKPLPPTPGM